MGGGLDYLTIVLMLLASLLHASWHSLVKSGDDQLAVLTGMCLVSSATAVLFLPFLAMPTGSVWLVLACSVVLHSAYRFSLAYAYAIGDFGQAYPLARGFVPIFSTIIAVWFLGQTPSPLQLTGILIVSVGVMMLASERLRHVRGPLLLAAMCVGVTVAGYAVLDAYGTRKAGDWLAYTAWLIVLDSGGFLLLMWAVRRRQLWTDLAQIRGRVVASGFLGLASFGVYVWALSGSQVGAVSSLRETSILFAAIIAILVHGEPVRFRRLFAAAIVFAGIMCFVI